LLLALATAAPARRARAARAVNSLIAVAAGGISLFAMSAEPAPAQVDMPRPAFSALVPGEARPPLLAPWALAAARPSAWLIETAFGTTAPERW